MVEYFSGAVGIGEYYETGVQAEQNSLFVQSGAVADAQLTRELVALIAYARSLCPEAVVQVCDNNFVVWRRVGLAWWTRGSGGISSMQEAFRRGEGGSSYEAVLCNGVREGCVHPAEDAIGLLVLRAQAREQKLNPDRCRYCLQLFGERVPHGNIGCVGGLYCGDCMEFAEYETREALPTPSRRGVQRCLSPGSTIDAEPDGATEQAPPENVWGISRSLEPELAEPEYDAYAYGIPRKRVTLEPVPMSDTRRMAARNGGVPVHTPLDRRIAVAQMIVEARHPRRAPWDWDPED